MFSVVKKSIKNKTVFVQIELPIEENLRLQELADSENITKKEFIKNIISAYLKEKKVSELLPTFLDDVHHWTDFLNDLKGVSVHNTKLLQQNNNLLNAMAGIDKDLENETQDFLENKAKGNDLNE